MIALEGIAVRVGSFALNDISLTVPTNAMVVLMGRSGCGKTTLLEIIAGLRKPMAGRVILDGRDVTTDDPAARNIGYVPQEGVLFPELTIRRHLELGPRMRLWDAERIAARVRELSELLNLTRLLDRRPDQLSGGERQRAALGRAVASEPSVVLLDEPLSALDDESRSELHAALKSLRQRANFTSLVVTHCRNESRNLGDIVVTMAAGEIESPVPFTSAAAPASAQR